MPSDEQALKQMVYAKRSDVHYTVSNGIVTIHRQHDHRIQKFVRKWLHWKIPEQSTLTLDAYGSLVFQLIDGTRTVWAIAEELVRTYPETETHLTTRLLLYLNRLEKDEHLVVCLTEA
ncbi:MAG: PqqD family protein [Aerococcus sp.]|nr:PqqD family protein [Aerococcus sp.]